MLNNLSEQAGDCYERAAEAERRAKEEADPILRKNFLDAAWRWRRLAHSHELTERLGRFISVADKGPQVPNPSAMSEIGPRTSTSTTLGDVLYAKSKARVSEQEWAALVQSIASGDERALHALYERAHRPVFTLAMRITANRETAEELTIDVFHDVWRRASKYDPANGTVLGWIMNQARSRAIDRLRFESRKKRSNGGAEQPPDELAAHPQAMLELREQTEALRAALTVLTPDEQQAIETTFFSGLTHAEAAARLNQPLGTVKTRIRSGLHKLRQALAAKAGKP